MGNGINGEHLEGRVALVTGASRGLGAAIADELAKAGAYVVGTGTSASSAQRVTDRFDQLGVPGHGETMDVRDSDNVQTVFKSIKADYGAPTILVNNAGITQDNLLMRMSEDQWDEVIQTNLASVYRLSKMCLRDMLKNQWGRIINISSVVGSIGQAGQANYSASKAGILGFTKSLAREVAAKGITVNAVAPGFIESDMTAGLSDEQKQHIEQQIPMQYCGRPEDVANTVLFLASENSRYITGQTMHVNGGMYMD